MSKVEIPEEMLPTEKACLVTVKGRPPGLLMNNPAYMLAQKKPGPTTRRPPLEEQAEQAAYRMKNKQLYIPSTWFYGSLLESSKNYKIGRRSAMSYVAGTVKVVPSEISLNTEVYEIDVRTVVIKGNRVVKARPLFKEWEATFFVIYDPTFGVTSDLLKQIFIEAGRRIGIGDYRPTHKGQFGTFLVTKWEDL